MLLSLFTNRIRLCPFGRRVAGLSFVFSNKLVIFLTDTIHVNGIRKCFLYTVYNAIAMIDPSLVTVITKTVIQSPKIAWADPYEPQFGPGITIHDH